MFDINTLLQGTITGANATKRELHPVGEFVGVIKTIKGKSGTIDKIGSENFGQPWARLDVFIESDDARVKEQGLSGITHGVMLDLVNGNLDMSKGKNVQLGKLREATGTNGDGVFQFAMMEGKPVRYTVAHEPAKDKPGEIYDRVVGLARV